MYRYIAPAGLVALLLTVLMAQPPKRFVALLPLVALAESSDSAVTRIGSVHTLAATLGDDIVFYRGTFRDGPFERIEGATLRGQSPELHRIDDQWVCVYALDGEIALATAPAPHGPFTVTGTYGKGLEPTMVRDRTSGQLSMIYVAGGIYARPFTFQGGLAWSGEPRLLAKTGRSPSVVEALDSNWMLISRDDGIAIGKLGREKLEDVVPLVTERSPTLGGAWAHPSHSAVLLETAGIYSMYFHAAPRRGEQRAVLRATLSFVDDNGKPVRPYLVEDRIARSGALTAR